MVHIRSWSDEHVLLDEGSGDTHLVGPQFIDALLRLTAARGAEVTVNFDAAPDNSLTRATQDADVLQTLLELELVEPLDR